MGRFGSEPGDFDRFVEEIHPGIAHARVIARRLDQVVQEMGHGISDLLYRRARDAVVRGNSELITADRDSNQLLRELLRQGPSPAPTRPALLDIGLPRDPRQLRQLWGNLSRADREEMFRRDPFLGNRNGIPHTDRDFYNRRTLADLRQRARTQDESEGLANLAKLLEESDREPPRFYLSYLDGDHRMAFSLDNPDTADNTAVLLQPAGRAFEEIPYAVPMARQLREVALLAAPGERTAVAFWGDYDQPRSMTQAIFPAFAQDGAARAREFHEGLRATHEGGGAHTTTIGHSYASVLAGHSAGNGEALDTDNVLFMGSWGTGVDRVGDLSITGVSSEHTAERVFATISSGDYMSLMPDTHGILPTAEGFGATVFESSALIPGNFTKYDHDSAAYLHSTNPASANIGLVITGRGDLVS